MAYDTDLAERIRVLVPLDCDPSEQKMFGGLAFLVRGNLAVCAGSEGRLLVRVDAVDHADLVQEAHVDAMVMGARTSRTWVRVDAEALVDEADLERWVGLGLSTALALPPK